MNLGAGWIEKKRELDTNQVIGALAALAKRFQGGKSILIIIEKIENYEPYIS